MLYAGRTVGITLCTYAGRVKDSKPIQLQLPLSGTVGAGGDAAEQTVEFQRRLRTGIVQPREKSADLCLSAHALCFLKQCGYQNGCALDLVQQLQEKLCESQDFPHEIGLFLGYPFEDVQGFIQNRGCNCRLCGYWKVYANECEKKRLFEKYSHCRNVYCRKWTEGLSIQRLTVAG